MVLLRHPRLVRTALFVGVLLATGTVTARAAIVRVRWKPGLAAPAAGYRIYVRPAGAPYGRPIEIGVPPPAIDGTLTAFVPGLDASPAYHVAVASYDADGRESPLSGELAVGVLNPCAIDVCTGIGSCRFGPEDDGTWCMHADETDPCLAVGACVAGTCTAGSLSSGLVSTRVRLHVCHRKGALSVRGIFSADPTLDPRVTGATLEIADESGAILYRASVPGEGFTVFDRGAGFRYVTGRRTARAFNGLRVLNLHRSDRDFRVTARAESAELRIAIGEPTLHATLRFGDNCARDLALACRALVGGGSSCR